MLIKQLIDLKKLRSEKLCENLKFRTDLWDWVMDNWSVTQQPKMIVYKDKLLKKSSNQNWSLICQGWSLHGFQTSHFICNQFGCKLWLQSIQNHAWHRFQDFARRHLKLLCCSIRIWADSLSSGRSTTKVCCFAQDSIRNMWFCSYVIFLLRDQWMIKGLSKAMSVALVSNKFLLIPSKYSFHMKKKWLVTAHYLQSMKFFCFLNWISFTRVVARCPQASQSLPTATAAD